jgi:hypothetical protein
MFLINFDQWKCACVGINNLVILLRARYKRNHVTSSISRTDLGGWVFRLSIIIIIIIIISLCHSLFQMRLHDGHGTCQGINYIKRLKIYTLQKLHNVCD